jgi:hypothetical protein
MKVKGTSVYILNYTVVMTNGKSEDKTQFFTDKVEFIKEYLRLKDAWYCYNLTPLKAESIKALNLDSALDF